MAMLPPGASAVKVKASAVMDERPLGRRSRVVLSL